MDTAAAKSQLFQVYLRLRPPHDIGKANERYLTVEPPTVGSPDGMPQHITVDPPSETRRRAVEKYTFTKVFEEDTTQLDIFHGVEVLPLVEGVLGKDGSYGRDGLLATLGVTGSGKTHTILGSKSQRGLSQISLDLLYKSLEGAVVPATDISLYASLVEADASEAQIIPATLFFEGPEHEKAGSRAGTPMCSVGTFPSSPRSDLYPQYPLYPDYQRESSPAETSSPNWEICKPQPRSLAKTLLKKDGQFAYPSRRQVLASVNNMPVGPDLGTIKLEADPEAEYAILVSMYEVYNDRIFDLLSPQPNVGTIGRNMVQKDRRRPLLFKSTEKSPDRKLVTGLRKIICGTLREAFMVLEAGLLERRTTGTGSNAVSSRSHGFFCVEVLKRPKRTEHDWFGSVLTIVDLAGSERARNAKTAGATLAEAGKINESLMYLGQCLQMQSDNSADGLKPSLVPFRQCKLTELLFSNSFPSHTPSAHVAPHHRNPQRAIMIVTADPRGDFNATSQILRYSALAREITVPRIPSVTSIVFSNALSGTKSERSPSLNSQDALSREELIVAAEEIARLTGDLEVANFKLTESERLRQEAVANWQDAEDKCENLEAEIRAECFSEFEQKMLEERARWRAAWERDQERVEEHLDRKVEFLANGLEIYTDDTATTGTEESQRQIEQLETENDRLRRELDKLRREQLLASPTKAKRSTRSSMMTRQQQAPLSQAGTPNVRTRSSVATAISEFADDDTSLGENIAEGKLVAMMQAVAIDEEENTPENTPLPASPVKRVRKLTSKKWEEVLLSPEV